MKLFLEYTHSINQSLTHQKVERVCNRLIFLSVLNIINLKTWSHFKKYLKYPKSVISDLCHSGNDMTYALAKCPKIDRCVSQYVASNQ